jgi:hypothetical protein
MVFTLQMFCVNMLLLDISVKLLNSVQTDVAVHCFRSDGQLFWLGGHFVDAEGRTF